VGESLAETARLSGEWLVCRLGCTQCCIGPFAISQLDVRRLRAGWKELAAADPVRAAAVRLRAEEYVAAAGPGYPGDPVSGLLEDEDALPEALDELPCPALDPETGGCDLYAARPMTCRKFGPVTRTSDDTMAACELCYEGATNQQMIDCAVEIDPGGLEDRLVEALAAQGIEGTTIVAFALAGAG
jgi:Fe-S-cluster containining protein